MDDEEVKLACLKLAFDAVGGGSATDIVKAAGQFYDFVYYYEATEPKEETDL